MLSSYMKKKKTDNNQSPILKVKKYTYTLRGEHGEHVKGGGKSYLFFALSPISKSPLEATENNRKLTQTLAVPHI